MNNSKRIYRAAIYVRLSKEDGDLDDVRKAESNSISNQKSLILNYLKDKEDIEIVSIREDDGYSGATFDRPAFKLMMQDVKDGIIDCIVVKDDCVIIEPTQKDLENQGFVAGSICF